MIQLLLGYINILVQCKHRLYTIIYLTTMIFVTHKFYLYFIEMTVSIIIVFSLFSQTCMHALRIKSKIRGCVYTLIGFRDLLMFIYSK